MIAIEKDIEKYMSEVNSHLFCLQKNKKAVLEDIREAILEFTENNEVETIDVIYSRFGTPEEIAKAYIADAEPQNIKKAFNIRKMLVASVVIALAILAITVIITIIDNHSGKIIYYESGVIEEVAQMIISSNFISSI
ncbi:MAG: hypothetical protein IJA31_08405 [Clostridia bacterium]|nr:hypothetical protein [Clostridia bacterium]MBQ4630811.1 hypothetical protein [Clostridia bacterium]MBQ6863657.1 hypothetical protein [Clostridia bacterium]